jgi:hypothetical protein
MGRRKPPPIKYDLFNQPCDEVSIWENGWGAKVATLHAEGFRSLCIDWWRSRYYEYLGCDKQAKTHEEWAEKSQKYKTWPIIWKAYQNKMCQL